MANKRSDYPERERDMWSGTSGQRERSTTGRMPDESGIERDEMRGHERGESSKRGSEKAYTGLGTDYEGRSRPKPESDEETGESGFSSSSKVEDTREKSGKSSSFTDDLHRHDSRR